MNMPPLVSPQWLADHLDNPAVGIIENSWSRESFAGAHIPGALPVPVYPTLKRFDGRGGLTQHVMAAAEFLALCRQLGLQRERSYVVYDDDCSLYAARFRWVCRFYGLNVSVLDGGWRAWCEQGLPVSAVVEPVNPETDVNASPRSAQIINREELLRCYDDPGVQLWDTRRSSEYLGQGLTGNLRQGHIPGALHLEWSELLWQPTGGGEAWFLKPPAELHGMLKRLGLSREKTIVTYCQSGNRATVASLVLDLLQYPHHRLYDASMGEWANLQGTPLATGE